jgi:hypothetical protein
VKRLRCELRCHSNGLHLQQIYTGFTMLRNCGLVDVRQKFAHVETRDRSKPFHLEDAKVTHLAVIFNEEIKLYYDLHDSYEIDEYQLRAVDVYFKRSYSNEYVKELGPSAKKVKPLGLNYLVYPPRSDWHGAIRSLVLGNGLEKLKSLKALRFGRGFSNNPAVDEAWDLPRTDAAPRILFMLRAWDPYDDPERPEEKVEQRRRINEMRASCVRALRDEFGDIFLGGFAHTEFAKAAFPDLLLPDVSLSSKMRYMKLLREYPICIATRGLHGSIGWKFGEYVAYSKAILSEKLEYDVPGNLECGRNYLEFESAESCVAVARRLVADPDLMREMMINNHNYYNAYVRADMLVLNSLYAALLQ